MTPAEELRAAATKLRETQAELANYSDIRGLLNLPEWAEWFGPDDHINLPVVNAWIALMHPGLAEPLAVLLDDLAAFTSLVESEPPPGHVAGKALAVARAINGGAE